MLGGSRGWKEFGVWTSPFRFLFKNTSLLRATRSFWFFLYISLQITRKRSQLWHLKLHHQGETATVPTIATSPVSILRIQHLGVREIYAQGRRRGVGNCCSSDGTLFPPPVEVWCLWIKHFTMFLALNSYLWIEAHTVRNPTTPAGWNGFPETMGESDGMSSWIDPSPTFTFTIFPVGNMYQHGRCFGLRQAIWTGNGCWGPTQKWRNLSDMSCFNGWNTSKISRWKFGDSELVFFASCSGSSR